MNANVLAYSRLKEESCFMCIVIISSIQKQKAVAANALIKLFFPQSFYLFIIRESAAKKKNFVDVPVL